ncbi:MAG: clan AA aspartic protease [Bacteroidia bacterium]
MKALVDTDALHLVLPEHIVIQLELKELEKREVTTADGKRHSCSYVGPVQIKFKNRSCFAGALVLGNEVLLGTIPIDDMDLVVYPAKQKIDVNPDNPNMAVSIVK